MQNPNPKQPEIDDPSITDLPMGDNPEDSDDEMTVAAPEDKSMPSQRGGGQGMHGGGGADTGVNKFQTNEKKYGGKPPGDESIANRGVTNANANKDKTV